MRETADQKQRSALHSLSAGEATPIVTQFQPERHQVYASFDLGEPTYRHHVLLDMDLRKTLPADVQLTHSVLCLLTNNKHTSTAEKN